MPKTNVFVKVTSAVAIAGEIHSAGSIVQVDEDLAINLLQRGKVELATADDATAEALDAAADDTDDADDAKDAAPEQKPAANDKPAKPDKPAK